MTKPLPFNPTPKEEFLATPGDVKSHRQLLDRPDFQRALRVALAQYNRAICSLAPSGMDTPNQLQASAMCFQRIQGATDFVDVLLKLSEVPRLPERKKPENLTHE